MCVDPGYLASQSSIDELVTPQQQEDDERVAQARETKKKLDQIRRVSDIARDPESHLGYN